MPRRPNIDIILGLRPPYKKPGPKPKPLHERKKARTSKPLTRPQQSYTKMRKVEVLVWLLKTRMLEIRGPQAALSMRVRNGISRDINQDCKPDGTLTFRPPTSIDAHNFWKIPPGTINAWWLKRADILGRDWQDIEGTNFFSLTPEQLDTIWPNDGSEPTEKDWVGPAPKPFRSLFTCPHERENEREALEAKAQEIAKREVNIWIPKDSIKPGTELLQVNPQTPCAASGPESQGPPPRPPYRIQQPEIQCGQHPQSPYRSQTYSVPQPLLGLAPPHDTYVCRPLSSLDQAFAEAAAAFKPAICPAPPQPQRPPPPPNPPPAPRPRGRPKNSMNKPLEPADKAFTELDLKMLATRHKILTDGLANALRPLQLDQQNTVLKETIQHVVSSILTPMKPEDQNGALSRIFSASLDSMPLREQVWALNHSVWFSQQFNTPPAPAPAPTSAQTPAPVPVPVPASAWTSAPAHSPQGVNTSSGSPFATAPTIRVARLAVSRKRASEGSQETAQSRKVRRLVEDLSETRRRVEAALQFAQEPVTDESLSVGADVSNSQDMSGRFAQLAPLVSAFTASAAATTEGDTDESDESDDNDVVVSNYQMLQQDGDEEDLDYQTSEQEDHDPGYQGVEQEVEQEVKQEKVVKEEIRLVDVPDKFNYQGYPVWSEHNALEAGVEAYRREGEPVEAEEQGEDAEEVGIANEEVNSNNYQLDGELDTPIDEEQYTTPMEIIDQAAMTSMKDLGDSDEETEEED